MKKILILCAVISSFQSHSQLINQGEAKKIQCMTSAEMKAYRTEIFAKRDAVLREKNIIF